MISDSICRKYSWFHIIFFIILFLLSFGSFSCAELSKIFLNKERFCADSSFLFRLLSSLSVTSKCHRVTCR